MPAHAAGPSQQTPAGTGRQVCSIEEEHSTYESQIFGCKRVRLQRPPPAMQRPRATRKDVQTLGSRALVLAFAHETCAVSPCGRGVRCTQVGQVRETRQALILRDTKAGLWSEFAKKHPDLMNETSFYQILNEEVGSSAREQAEGFVLKEVLPPHLAAAARSRTRGARLQQLQGMGPTRYVLNVDMDNTLREACE